VDRTALCRDLIDLHPRENRAVARFAVGVSTVADLLDGELLDGELLDGELLALSGATRRC
jgi:hypothetical protein